MAKSFDAKKFIFVPATGHPKNAEFRVAWGKEKWNFEEGVREVQVTKAQMVYNGNVAGMLSPSYVDGTLDDVAVQFAMKLLKDDRYGTNSKTIKDTVVVRELSSEQTVESLMEEAATQIREQNHRIFLEKTGKEVTVNVSLRETTPLSHETMTLQAFIFRVEVSEARY